MVAGSLLLGACTGSHDADSSTAADTTPDATVEAPAPSDTAVADIEPAPAETEVPATEPVATEPAPADTELAVAEPEVTAAPSDAGFVETHRC